MKIPYKKLIYTLTFLLFFCVLCFAQEDPEDNEENTGGIIFKIITTPDDAEVYINKKLIGISPLNKLKAAKGRYEVYIFKDGYIPLKTHINLNENTRKFEFTLIKKKWEPASNEVALKYFVPFFSELRQELRTSFFFSYKYIFPSYSKFKDFDIEVEVGLVNMYLKYTLNSIPEAGRTVLTIVPLNINFHYNFFRKFSYISPYIGAGFGVTVINVKVDNYEKTSLAANLMAGINFFVKSPISAQIEIRYTWLGNANIPAGGVDSGSGPNITDRKYYKFSGFLVNFALVGRF
jgi:hypothetical protein